MDPCLSPSAPAARGHGPAPSPAVERAVARQRRSGPRNDQMASARGTAESVECEEACCDKAASEGRI
eukprot:5132708-Pleurochrysis_carterae.AAC.1